jgi:putative membrane protein
VLATLATVSAHVGAWGPGPGWLALILIPLFWIGLIALFITLARRRWSRGPGHYAPWANPGKSAESTLAERFANGDIDEKEYRARLEVLRANNPYPQKP